MDMKQEQKDWNQVHCCDVIEGLSSLGDESVDMVIIDPPYNIGYDFGNNKCRKGIKQYVEWAQLWLRESERILKPTGTMFVYGFSEILAHLSVNINLDHRWLIWHYTNKTVPSSKFWQRTHESIICAWKDKGQRIFNRDDVREPYTENFIKGYKGKKRTRPTSSGRFGETRETVYTVNEKGALPRDVIKVPTLAGGAGSRSRIAFCKDCDEVLMGTKEIKLHKEHDIFKHPTQKPFELTKRLMLSVRPEQAGKVVVPFVGSGSEIFVAKHLGLDYIGFDINQEYVTMANKLTEKGYDYPTK